MKSSTHPFILRLVVFTVCFAVGVTGSLVKLFFKQTIGRLFRKRFQITRAQGSLEEAVDGAATAPAASSETARQPLPKEGRMPKVPAGSHRFPDEMMGAMGTLSCDSYLTYIRALEIAERLNSNKATPPMRIRLGSGPEDPTDPTGTWHLDLYCPSHAKMQHFMAEIDVVMTQNNAGVNAISEPDAEARAWIKDEAHQTWLAEARQRKAEREAAEAPLPEPETPTEQHE